MLLRGKRRGIKPPEKKPLQAALKETKPLFVSKVPRFVGFKQIREHLLFLGVNNEIYIKQPNGRVMWLADPDLCRRLMRDGGWGFDREKLRAAHNEAKAAPGKIKKTLPPQELLLERLRKEAQIFEINFGHAHFKPVSELPEKFVSYQFTGTKLLLRGLDGRIYLMNLKKGNLAIKQLEGIKKNHELLRQINTEGRWHFNREILSEARILALKEVQPKKKK